AAQGEFPRCVFAPKNARDAFYLTIKAFNIAEKYQLPVIILSDQYLADSIQTFKKFDLSGIKIERGILTDGELRKIKDYKRHLFTESGISPRAYPSQVDTVVVTDSDEHAEDGHLTEGLEIRVKMTEKRLKKLEGLKEEIAEPEIYGNRDAKTMLIGWGSTHGVIREVVDILTNRGKSVNMMQFSEIWPFLAEYVSKILDKPEKSFVIENNATGQLARVIRTETGRMVSGKILKYDGRPFTPEYIIRELEVQGGI
ncbi:MAG: 2-oxoacid:acceptor oxidoreductase subunit alpha, partial [Fidelibacterota bacterium]